MYYYFFCANKFLAQYFSSLFMRIRFEDTTDIWSRLQKHHFGHIPYFLLTSVRMGYIEKCTFLVKRRLQECALLKIDAKRRSFFVQSSNWYVWAQRIDSYSVRRIYSETVVHSRKINPVSEGLSYQYPDSGFLPNWRLIFFGKKRKISFPDTLNKLWMLLPRKLVTFEFMLPF